MKIDEELFLRLFYSLLFKDSVKLIFLTYEFINILNAKVKIIVAITEIMQLLNVTSLIKFKFSTSQVFITIIERIYPAIKPNMIPNSIRIIFSLFIILITLLFLNPSTLYVAISFERSRTFILIKLYRTAKISKIEKTTKTPTSKARLFITSS